MAQKNEEKELTLKDIAMKMNDETPARRRNGKGYTRQEIMLMGETGVDAIIRNIAEQRRRGKPLSIKSRDQLNEVITAYWEYIFQSRESGVDITPTIESFCSHAGISRQTYKRWKLTNVNGYTPLLEQLETDIASVIAQRGIDGKIPPVIFATIMNNNHGYVQQTKVEVSNTGENDIMDRQALLDAVADLPEIEEK